MSGLLRRGRRGFVLAAALLLVMYVYFGPAGVRKMLPELSRRVPVIPACPGCNVVVISVESLRADALPCYGYVRNTAPRLCAYAEKHSIFTDFHSQSSLTLDTTFSMMTGLFPTSHGMIHILKDTLSPNVRTLAEVFRDRGYRTIYAGIADNENMPLDKGLGRGFAEVRAVGADAESNAVDYGDITASLTGDKPVFLFFYNSYLHPPYVAGRGPRKYVDGEFPHIPLTFEEYFPDTWEFYRYSLRSFEHRLRQTDTAASKERLSGIVADMTQAMASGNLAEPRRVVDALPTYEFFDLYATYHRDHLGAITPAVAAYMRGLYDERIGFTDAYLTPLLEVLDKPEVKNRTVVVITSPHGEAFGEKGRMGHGDSIDNTVTHVPLIVAVPGSGPARITSLGSSVDIFPTVLDFIGIPYKDIQGESLARAVLRGENDSAHTDRHIVSQHRGDHIQSIRNKAWKLYTYRDQGKEWYELYDMVSDYGESVDQASQRADIAGALAQKLRDILGSSAAPLPAEGFPAWIDSMKREEIIREGYF